MEKNENICYIASAGAGKTTHIINLVCEQLDNIKQHHKKIAIVTYTTNNQSIIEDRIKQQLGFIPNNIIVLGWFEFLLRYWINPYKGDIIGDLYNRHISIKFVDKPSGVRQDLQTGKYFYTYQKHELAKKYLTSNKEKIFSDKLSEFAYECYNKNKTTLLIRLENIFDSIFFDESQDFAGHDFEILKVILKSKSIWCVLAGDPRQHTFSTHVSRKNKEYEGKPDLYINKVMNSNRKKFVQLNYSDLICSHRCNKEICEFASKITPDYPMTQECSCDKCIEKKEKFIKKKGCFLLKENDVNNYIKEYSPCGLTWNKNIIVSSLLKYRMNFGDSKGCECDSVIIYPTQTMINWLCNPMSIMPPETKAKFYVAITRAKFTTAIVVSNDFDNKAIGLSFGNKDD